MSLIIKRIWTQTLSGGSVTINEEYGLTEISIILLSGTGTVIGTGYAGTLGSTSITLPVGVGLNLGSGSNAIIDGLTISTTGIVALVGR